jgi:CubicO group peptidase (beta-lactamase class C family)
MTRVHRTTSQALLLLWLSLPLWVGAQTVRPEQVGLSSERLGRIDSLIAAYIDENEISGAVTLVARNGRIAHLAAHGVMDIESKRPMRSDAMFRIASMSKPVAAVAILMLAEEGKLRLTDRISRFLPAFEDMSAAVISGQNSRGGFGGPPPAHYAVPAEREITILDLLTHTSGVMSGRVSNALAQSDSQTRHEAGLRWIEGLDDIPLEFQPGSRWSYSALAGFDVLSRIVEITSGETFNDFLRKRVFDRLGMAQTTFWPTPPQRDVLATSYVRTNEGLALRENPDSMSGAIYFSGAGGLMTTAEEYAQFAMMLANGGELRGQRLLGKRTVELMGSPYVDDTLPGRPPGEGFGLGVRVVTDAPARRTSLTEGSFGWSGFYGTHFWVDPDENLIAILFAQTSPRNLIADFENAVMQAVIE